VIRQTRVGATIVCAFRFAASFVAPLSFSSISKRRNTSPQIIPFPSFFIAVE
jgi:hypothetical protein